MKYKFLGFFRLSPYLHSLIVFFALIFEVYFKEGNKPDALKYFPARLFRRKDICACLSDGECYDIGTHEALSQARQRFGARVE